VTTNLVIGYPDIPYRGTISTNIPDPNFTLTHNQLSAGPLEPGHAPELEYPIEAAFTHEIADSSSIRYLSLLNANWSINNGANWIRLIRSTERATLPNDIGARAIYRASDGVTKDASNLVTAWADQSGNGHTLTASGSERPTWETNSASFNGNQAITFNGTSNIIRSGTALGTAYSGSDVPFVLALALKLSSTAGLQSMGFGASAPNPNCLYSPTNGAGLKRINRSDDAGVSTLTTGGVSSTNYEAIVFNFKGTTADLYVNGAIAINNTPMNVGVLTPSTFSLGAAFLNAAANFFSAASISECVVTDALSAGDLTSLINYMNDKHVTTPILSQALTSATPVGRRAKHLMFQMNTTALSKTWVLLSSSKTNRYRHSKQFLGQFLDLGRDPIFGRTTEAISDSAQQKRRRLKYELKWAGLTSAALSNFVEKIVERAEETVFLLATINGYHPVLQNDQVTPVYLTDWAAKYTSFNNVELSTTWEEALP